MNNLILYQFILDKYNLSKKIYKKVFKDEQPNIFLFYFDILNVYNLFPTIIDFLLTPNEMLNIEDIESNTDNSMLDKINNYKKKNKEYKKLLKENLNELSKGYENDNNDDIFIRKFFSYEIIDNIVDNYGGEYITVAWLKCYEILEWYNMINHDTSTTKFNYFGICEQPGAFVYAINHYVKTKTNKDFNFILQSLKTMVSGKKTGFKAEDALYKEHGEKYDYGDGTGDVTNILNIKYYRKKYYDTHFDLITADCGIDSSDDFSLQEKSIFKIFYGQLLIAISLADIGTNYFTKLFTMYEVATVSLINLLTRLFEKVYVSRVLTTKPTSGEIYCVCKNFKYDKQFMEPYLQKLYLLYEASTFPTFSLKSELTLTNTAFFDEISLANEVLLYRRIISHRSSHFRYNNRNYTTENKLVVSYIKDMVEHYKEYFMKHYKIIPLDKDKKLVSKVFINKWSNSK